MAGETLLQTRLGGGIRSRYHSGGALNRLSSWVHHHKVLYRALADSGYTDRQRMFNSVQVELIFRYLGRP